MRSKEKSNVRGIIWSTPKKGYGAYSFCHDDKIILKKYGSERILKTIPLRGRCIIISDVGGRQIGMVSKFDSLHSVVRVVCTEHVVNMVIDPEAELLS